MSDTLKERLDALALDVWDDDVPAAQVAAEKIAALAAELGGLYVPADAEGERPTNAQGVELARVMRDRWSTVGHDIAYNVTVTNGAGAYLPDGFITFDFVDGYHGGISPEGRVST